jgi:transcription factor WhiB
MADWRDQARCRDLLADEAEQLFFPGVGKSTTAARVYCAECPVGRPCLEFAMATRNFVGTVLTAACRRAKDNGYGVTGSGRRGPTETP